MFFGPKSVTLVFTDTSIRIAKAAPSSRGVKISYVAKKNLPPSTVFNGRITNENLFRESLKSLYLEAFDQIKTRDLILGLNEQDGFITTLSFDKKPRDLQKNISQYLIDKLPFDLSKATIRYKEASPNTFQIIAVRADTLNTLNSVFSDVGFHLKAIVPVTLLFPEMVGKQNFPYLVVSSGEDISFLLVVGNAIVFSSTINLKTKLNESDKEIIKIAREIIDEEYTKNNETPLKKVYLFGSNANILKGFFVTAGFDAQVIAAVNDSAKQASYDVSEFGRCIALSFYNSSILSFYPGKSSPKKPEGVPKRKNMSLIKYFLLAISLLLMLGLVYFYRSGLQSRLFPTENSVTDHQQQTTSSAILQPKEPTQSSQKQATPSAEAEKPTINKKDFKIRVVNGSGTAGAASEAENFLESKSYSIVSIGNAGNFNYQQTEVRIKKSKQAISGLLTKDLEERYSITVGSNLPEAETYDVLITIGGL